MTPNRKISPLTKKLDACWFRYFTFKSIGYCITLKSGNNSIFIKSQINNKIHVSVTSLFWFLDPDLLLKKHSTMFLLRKG